MDYYATMRNDYVHKQMYPTETRTDWIPKGPPSGTLTIKPKDRCAPRFVTKIEGNAVEEGVKVFFEGIVDAQPQPKFNWYFNDEPIVPGQRGFEEAEIHDSRKMSTLILRYAREHQMGKYTLVASNQLGTAESNCDLIVRKKQFPPVFWQRLYNVSGSEDSVRYVGGVEVGGWPVPEVYWYRVLEDGTEEEVVTRTHTENWNGNPNKYVPSSMIEIRQIDQIRHCIIFNQVGEGYSGLYRVRAVNCLGEAECEADIHVDGAGGCGDDMYLPPLWREKRRLTWKDEDMRKKPFVGYNEPELSPEEIEAMKKGSGLVPLSRITEYLASLPDYKPTDKFNNMERIPFKAGVDERDYRPTKKGGSVRFPGKFQKGKITHHGYNTDAMGRILPKWHNKKDPRSRDSSDWRWKPVHPDLYVPEFPARCQSPEPVPVWETKEDILQLIRWLRSMGCKVLEAEAKEGQQSQQPPARPALPKMKEPIETQHNNAIHENSYAQENQTKKQSKVQKFSYTRDNQHTALSEEEMARKKEQKEKKIAMDIAHEAQEAIQGHALQSMIKSDHNSAIFTNKQAKASQAASQHSEAVYESHVTSSQTQSRQFISQQTQVQTGVSKQEVSKQEVSKQEVSKQEVSKQEVSKQAASQHTEVSQQTASHQSKDGSQQQTSQTALTQKAASHLTGLLPAQTEVSQQQIFHQSEVSSQQHMVTSHTEVTHQLSSSSQQTEVGHQSRAMYSKQDNLSFPELEKLAQPPPALPPKTKIMHSPSRNIFSPTESIESSGTASVKTVEFIPVKEKIKMIAAQQEELMRKEEASKSQGSSQVESKQKGVRILPPSPVTVRKMMVEEELQHYDTAVTRTTPTVEMMDSRMNTLERRQQAREDLSVTPLSMVSGVSVPGWNTPQDILEQCKQKYEVDQAFEQLVAESSSQQTSSMVQSSQVQSSSMVTSSSKTMTAAEECRRSFEQAELEAMALDSSSCASYSKQSSMVDTQSVQSFVYQSGTTVQQQQSQQQQTKQQSEHTQQNHVTQKQQVSYSKQQRSNSAASFERSNSRNSNNSDDISRSRKTLRSPGPFIRQPDTFSAPQSAPATPMSQRRRLRINQSPAPPPEADTRPNYREQLTASAFQPGFYRPPTEEGAKSPMFQLMKGKASKSSTTIKEESVRMSQASSTAYEGDSEL